MERHFQGKVATLTDQHTEAQAHLESLRQQRSVRQRQCTTLRMLCEQAQKRAHLGREWQEELEAEDLPGVRFGE
jgi:hypothetical protein